MTSEVETSQLAAQVQQLTRENMELRKQLGADLTEERQRQCHQVINSALRQQAEDAAVATAENSNNPLQVEVDQLKSELQGATVRQGELEKSIEDYMKTITFLNEELDSISTSYRHAQGAMAAWREEIGTMAKERDGYHQALEDARRSVSTETLQLRSQLENSALAQDELEAQLSRKDEQLGQLHGQLSEHIKGQQVVETATREKQSEITALEEKLESVQGELKFEHQENKRHGEQLAEENASVLALVKEERDHYKAQCEELTAKVEEYLLFKEKTEAEHSARSNAKASVAGGGRSPGDREPGSPTQVTGGGASTTFFSPGFPHSVGRYSAAKRNRDGDEGGAAAPSSAAPVGGAPPAHGGQHQPSMAALYPKFSAPSMRDKCIQFYNEGQKQIDTLEKKLTETTTVLKKLQEKEAEMNGILSDRQKTVLSMCALGTEVQKQKEELRLTRAQNTGLESTNGVLQSQLQGLLGTQMQEEDLKKCAQQLREHGAQAAQASGSILFDEGAMKKAMKEKQVLSHETQTLQREKERLQTVIAHRQATLESHNGMLASNFIRLNSVAIGEGNSKSISVQHLVDLVKELHPDEGSIQDLKLKLVNVSSKLQATEEERKNEAEKSKREVSAAVAMQQGLEMEADKLRKQLQSLQEEASQAHDTVQNLTKAKKKIEDKNSSLKAEAAQTVEATQRVQQTGLALITLLTKEVEQGQKLKGDIRTLREKVVELEAQLGYGGGSSSGEGGGEGSNHLEWGKLSDKNVHLITEALDRHVEAVSSVLAFEEAAKKGGVATEVRLMTDLIAQKDQLIREVTDRAVTSGKESYQKNKELKGEVAEAKLQLAEAKTWVATLEKKVNDLSVRNQQATQEQAFMGSAPGKNVFSWVPPAGAKKPTGAASTNKAVTEPQMPTYLRDMEVGIASATTTAPSRQVSFSASAAPATAPLVTGTETRSSAPAALATRAVSNAHTVETLVVDGGTQDDGDSAPTALVSQSDATGTTVVVDDEDDAAPVAAAAPVVETEIFEEDEAEAKEGENAPVVGTENVAEEEEEDSVPGFGDEGF